MYKNKNGFTLIELLAVIVVLSIILIIGSTTVTKSINNSRNSAFMTSFDNLVDSVKNNIIQKKNNKNLQVECAVGHNLANNDGLPYCDEIYDYDSNEYEFYVLNFDNFYFVFLTGIGKFEKVNLREYQDTLYKKGIFLLGIDLQEEGTNNSLFTVISKNGKTLKNDEIEKALSQLGNS